MKMAPVCTKTQAQLRLLTEYDCVVIEKLEAVSIVTVLAHDCILLLTSANAVCVCLYNSRRI